MFKKIKNVIITVCYQLVCDVFEISINAHKTMYQNIHAFKYVLNFSKFKII